MNQRSINVIGKVQGVYFRASTKQQADKLGLKGTVQNLSDGSVQIEVVGEETILEKFQHWCCVGPEKAVVDKLVVKEKPFTDTFSDFKILR